MMNTSVETKTISNKIRVLDKLNAEKVPYILINMVVSKDKKTKKVNGIVPGWNEQTYDYMMEHYNNQRLKSPKKYNVIMVNLKKSPYMVADCDTNDDVRRANFNKTYGQC